MSSILASLDMSLDDIISKKKPAAKNPDARPTKASGGRGRGAQNAAGSGPQRGGRSSGRRRAQPYTRRGAADDDDLMDVEDDAPVSTRKVAAATKRKPVAANKKQEKGGKKSSILARLGKAKDGEAAQAGTKILVKNLKFDILEEDVTELFSTVGKVNKAEIVYDRSGRSKGLARVWYARRADAEKAIKEYDGRTLDGQPMQISLDTDKNVRNGFFGTALAGGDDSSGVKFNVSLGGRGGQKGRRGGRGGRGGNQNSKSAEDLDNEMDTYMKDA